MSRLRRLWFILLALMVVGGHVAMLTSDRMPFDVALRLTLVNAAIWAVLLLPLLLFALLRR